MQCFNLWHLRIKNYFVLIICVGNCPEYFIDIIFQLANSSCYVSCSQTSVHHHKEPFEGGNIDDIRV